MAWDKYSAASRLNSLSGWVSNRKSSAQKRRTACGSLR